jgi:hypothetical protein
MRLNTAHIDQPGRPNFCYILLTHNGNSTNAGDREWLDCAAHVVLNPSFDAAKQSQRARSRSFRLSVGQGGVSRGPQRTLAHAHVRDDQGRMRGWQDQRQRVRLKAKTSCKFQVMPLVLRWGRCRERPGEDVRVEGEDLV